MAAGKVARHETKKIVRPHPVAPPRPVETYQDELAVEEPLELRVNDQPLTVILRTPGDDNDLAAGYLYTDGVIQSEKDITSIQHLPVAEHAELQNIVNVTLANGAKHAGAPSRNYFANGMSGKAAVEAARKWFKAPQTKSRLRIDVLYEMANTMRKARTHFDRNGGLHAAGIFDGRGVLRMLREDVERRNAFDKALGAMIFQGHNDFENDLLLVTGRASFDILQRAVVSKFQTVCSVNTPSSLAVDFAREFGITLICFLPGEELNVYTHAERIGGTT